MRGVLLLAMCFCGCVLLESRGHVGCLSPSIATIVFETETLTDWELTNSARLAGQ